MDLPRLALVGICGCGFSGPPGATGEPVDAAPDIDAPITIDAPVEPNARVRTVTIGAVPIGTAVQDAVVPVQLVNDADYIANSADDGLDLLFQLADGTVLAHDIEAREKAGGNLIVWVRLPTLEPAGATFEMFYGDGNVAPASGNAWANLADLVFHFERASGVLPDHSPSNTPGTFNANGGTIAATAGQVGAGVDLTQSFINLPDSNAADRGDQSFALSFWFSQDATVGGTDLGWHKGGGTGTGYEVSLGTNNWRVNIDDGNGLETAVFGTEAVLGGAGFVHLVLVVDRDNNDLIVYTNGVEADSSSFGGGFGSVSNTVIGRVGGQNEQIDGDFDELRAYTRLLSADYIAADHALATVPNIVTVGAAGAGNYPGT